jgi:MFS family permease
LFFAARGLGIEPIGVLKAVYPGVWGILQTLTGPLSDRIGRKELIVGGCGSRLSAWSWSPC